jgi:hypothetical protein
MMTQFIIPLGKPLESLMPINITFGEGDGLLFALNEQFFV